MLCGDGVDQLVLPEKNQNVRGPGDHHTRGALLKGGQGTITPGGHYLRGPGDHHTRGALLKGGQGTITPGGTT